mgnify:CR=1 FL=1
MSPELASAADVLSDQLREQLQRLASSLEPHLDKLDRRFAAVLKKQGVTARQCTSLLEISPGAAARILSSGRPAIHFLEQVEYQGRRLAKLNLNPSAVMAALEQYDILLTQVLRSAEGATDLAWAREQLSFCIVLSLDRKSTRLNSSHVALSRMPSSA